MFDREGWYRQNREWLLIYAKEYRQKRLEESPEKTRKQQREAYKRWRIKHPEKVKENTRKGHEKFRSEHPEADKKHKEKYRKSSKGLFTRKRERLRRRTGFDDKGRIFSRTLNKNILKYGTVFCENCGLGCWNKYQFDHIIPLVLGGKNEFDNFQILCPSCNLEKHVYAIDFRSNIHDPTLTPVSIRGI